MSGSISLPAYTKINHQSPRPRSGSQDSLIDLQGVRDEHERAAKRHRLHWKNPTLMGILLVAGAAVAISNHFFYRYWDRRVVQSDTQQKWVSRAGTGFAFCFRASLAASTGIAFVQQMWHCLQARPYKVDHINSMFTVLTSAPQFLNVKLWTRLPLLLLMAITTWSLPFAAIIPPGTLIVTSVQQNNYVPQIVPQLDLHNKPGAFGQFGTSPDDSRIFSGPTSDLIQLSLASAASASILSVNPPAPNASYTLDFHAPALSCKNATIGQYESLQTILYNQSNFFVGYMSWTPDESADTISNPPNLNDNDWSTLDSGQDTDTGARIFVYSSPNIGDETSPTALIGCVLENASYAIGFQFQNSQQSLSIQRGQGVGVVSPWSDTFTDFTQLNRTVPYASIMAAFGRIMTGWIGNGGGTGQGTEAPLPDATLVQSTAINGLLHEGADVLGRGLEDLFQNITLSLLSAAEFLVDSSSASVAPTNVTVIITQNLYTYQPFDLLLAYGLAILAAALCVAIGSLAILANGASYSSDFSTVLRTTRNSQLNSFVSNDETDGIDPLPNHIAETELGYRPLNGAGVAGFYRY